MKLLVLSLVLLGTLLDAAADLPDGVRREVSLCTGGTIVEITTSDPELVAVLRDQVKKLIGPDAACTGLDDGIRAEVTRKAPEWHGERREGMDTHCQQGTKPSEMRTTTFKNFISEPRA